MNLPADKSAPNNRKFASRSKSTLLLPSQTFSIWTSQQLKAAFVSSEVSWIKQLPDSLSLCPPQGGGSHLLHAGASPAANRDSSIKSKHCSLWLYHPFSLLCLQPNFEVRPWVFWTARFKGVRKEVTNHLHLSPVQDLPPDLHNLITSPWFS